MDHVDKIIAQWARERPDLDTGPMAIIGRMSRLVLEMSAEMQKTFRAHGLNAAGFDLLATLRRAGAPYRLSPGDLIASSMVTSGTMTNRIDQLVKAGLVERIAQEDDRRSVLVGLTAEGLARIEGMLEAHVATQVRLLAGLDAAERAQLDGLLRRMQAAQSPPA